MFARRLLERRQKGTGADRYVWINEGDLERRVSESNRGEFQVREHIQGGRNQGEANGQYQHGAGQDEGCHKRGGLWRRLHD